MTKNSLVKNNYKIYKPEDNPFAYIPMDVLNLLWFMDGPLKNCNRFKPAISLELPICLDYNWDYDNEPRDFKSFRFYDYKSMKPEERGAYILWLQNIYRDSETYFLRLFLLNVSRCLLECPEKFDAAFNMIISLYNAYESNGAKNDCADKLLTDLIYLDDKYMLKKAVDSMRDCRNSIVVDALAYLEEGMTGMDIVNYATENLKNKEINKKYLKEHTDLMAYEITNAINKIFGFDRYPVHMHKSKSEITSYDIYIESKVIKIKYCSYYGVKDFHNNLITIIKYANEQVKLQLKQNRATKKK